MISTYSRSSLAPAVKHFKTVDGLPSDYLGSLQLIIGCNKRWLQALPRTLSEVAHGFYPDINPSAFPQWLLDGLEDALQTGGFIPGGNNESNPTWVWEEGIDFPHEGRDLLDYPLELGD